MVAPMPARKQEEPPAGETDVRSDATRDRAREGRSELMERVTEFVLKHDVALTGSNLSTVVAALSGSNSAR